MPAIAWTGETACALQAAMQLTNEAFAARLGIGVRTVAGWHQKPTLRPQTEMREVLDTALDQAPADVQERFATLITSPPAADTDKAADAEERLSADTNISAALHWLDQAAGWPPGTARSDVASRLAQLDVRQLRDRANRRGRVDQLQIAEALGTYYRDPPGDHGQYTGHVDSTDALTSVLTRPGWLDLDCPLTSTTGRLSVTSTTADMDATLDAEAASHAAQRLAETLALGIRMVDMPLFELRSVNIRKARSQDQPACLGSCGTP